MNLLKRLLIIAPVILKKVITPKRLLFLFLLGIIIYVCFLYPNKEYSNKNLFFPHLAEDQTASFQRLPCPKFPKTGFFLSKNSLDNWKYIKRNSAYSCTGLIYVNSKPYYNKSGCERRFSTGEIFLFPGNYCRTNCDPCPNVNVRPKINCKATCPLNIQPSNRNTLHHQFAELLTGNTTDFMGFAIKYGENKNKMQISYNSFSCNPRWFGDKAIGQCDNVDWQYELERFLKKKLK